MTKYLTEDEIVNNQEVEEYLSSYTSKSIKSGFAISILQKYCTRLDSKILDCGAASGAFAEEIAKYGFKNIYGLDLRDYRKENNKKFFLDFKSANLNRDTIPYPNQFFDIVTAWCVIPHLENPHNFIREVFRVLKGGGIFVYSVPNFESLSSRKLFYKTTELIGYSEKNDHISIMTPAIFKKTVLKYFQLKGKKYFVKNKVFLGLKGRIRKFFYQLKPQLGKRYGSKLAYILIKHD